MKTPTRLFAVTLAAGLMATGAVNPVSPAHAQSSPVREPAIAGFDSRTPVAAKPETLALQQQGEAHLKAQMSYVTVDYDVQLGTPKFIRSSRGFLTGPNGQGGAVSATTAQALPANDPYRAVKGFLNENTSLFNFGAEALSGATVARDSVGAHNGLRTVVWQQQLDGLPVFESVLIGNQTSAGELVTLSSTFLSAPAEKADAGTPNRATLQVQPTVSAAQAILAGADNLGDALLASEVAATGATTGAGYQKFSARNKFAHARLVWLPLNGESLRLAWEVIITSQVTHTPFQILVDVETGLIHVRRSLSRDISNATYNVYTSDSPSPFSPSWPTPNNAQPPLVSRTLVTTPALDTTASPNGWINDGDNETQGNNTDTYTDRNFDGAPDGLRPQGNPNRVFDFLGSSAGLDG